MQQQHQQMGYPDWEEERLNLRHRSSSITGMAGNDWANHPSYPRPGHNQPVGGYPPNLSRRPAAPIANSSSAWDLSPQQFPHMAPTRGMTMQQVNNNKSNQNSNLLFS